MATFSAPLNALQLTPNWLALNWILGELNTVGLGLEVGDGGGALRLVLMPYKVSIPKGPCQKCPN